MNNLIDTISGSLAEALLIVEGAVAIFEKKKDTDSDSYSLIGEALYMMRERISDCLKSCQKGV